MKYATLLVAAALSPISAGAKEREYCNSGPPIECSDGRYNVCLMNGRLVWANSGFAVIAGTLLYLEEEGPVFAAPCPGSTDKKPVTFCPPWGCKLK
jgi:hypothetical protein